MNNGFFRVASAIPQVKVADCQFNANSIINLCQELDKQNVSVAVFPEMSLTAYTCGDLFHSSLLLEEAEKNLRRIIDSSTQWQLTAIVGMPISYRNVVYNCAVAINSGKIIAAIPKSYLANQNECSEKRWWQSGLNIDIIVYVAGQEVLLNPKQLIRVGDAIIGVEIGSDLFAPISPSTQASMAGAQIIFNLSATNTIACKDEYLNTLISLQSSNCIAGYVYAGAGYGESSTDFVFDGKAIIAECGHILAKNERWHSGGQYIIADIDLQAIAYNRRTNNTFNDCSTHELNNRYRYYIAEALNRTSCNKDLYRTINPHPFIPSEIEHESRCNEVVNIQVAGLAQRLEATKCKNLIIGISGGLDSTLALLVAIKTFDRLELDHKNITAVTMPGFGTTDRTYNNALTLMKMLGVTIREISIAKAVTQHFNDIEHDINTHDVTYENSQARERTQILMDIANQVGGMVLGTGDLSELALGWATYNGDHMSMYGVNAGVPKTLVKHLVRWFANNATNETLSEALIDIVETPISPELTPADNCGNIKQKTEDLVGPYELHDFYLYYMIRFGFSPRRIYFMAKNTTFDEPYTDNEIRHWLKTFCRRFFNQQFKRSCLPDGTKVGSVGISPRGDWHMPSDASSALWLQECENL